jgi:molecular chaperone GrpE
MTPGTGPVDGPGRPEDAAARPDAPSTPRPDVSDAAAVFAAAEEVVEQVEELVEEEFGDLVATVRRERDEYLDMLRRVQADFENYKKRMLRQQSDHLERAGEDLVMKMLPVLDAFDLARTHLGGGDDLGSEGKALLAASSLLADTLAKEGLERIDDPGAPFDPAVHEAVDRVSEESGDPAFAGPMVDGVLRAGYRWKGRVIRPAMVRVRG